MFATTLASVFEMVAAHVREAQASSHKARAARKVMARRQGGIAGFAGALLAVCCLLTAVFAIQPGFDANKVVRQVRGVSRPASGNEQGIDDGEFLIDTSVVYVPAHSGQYGPALAFDGTNLLAVWNDTRDAQSSGTDIFGTRISLDGEILNPGGLAICAADSNQVRPCVAFDGDNFLVIWEDSSESPFPHLRGRRVTPAGVVLDTEDIQVTGGGFGQDMPALAFDGTNYLAVWQERDTNYLLADIYGTRISKSGVVLDPEGIPIIAGRFSKWTPAVAWGGSSYLVVWADYRHGDYDIRGARVTGDGRVLDAGGFLITPDPSEQLTPSLSFDGANFLVVWEDNRRTGSTWNVDIYGCRVSPKAAILDPQGIPICPDSLQSQPRVAYDGSLFHVVWTDRRAYLSDIYGTRVSRDGVVLDPGGIRVAAAEQIQGHPAVASSGSGVTILWQDGRSGHNDIYGARVDGAGTPLDTSGILVSSAINRQEHPASAFGAGSFLVAWEEPRRDFSPDVYACRVSLSGVTLDSTPIAVVVDTLGAQEAPAVTFNGESYLVAWHRRGTPNHNIRGARVSATGTVLDTTPILLADESPDHQRLYPAAASCSTNSLVVWSDLCSSSATSAIHGVRVDRTGRVLDSTSIVVCPDYSEWPGLATDGVGYLVVWRTTWVGQYDVYGARVAQDGRVLDSLGIRIAAGPAYPCPRAAFDGTNYLVVWAEDVGQQQLGLFGARVTRTGIVLDPDGFRIATATGFQASQAVTFDGQNYIVVWTDGYEGDLYGARIAPSGTVLDLYPVAIGPHEQAAPSLAAAGDGQVLLAYQGWADPLQGRAPGVLRILGRLGPFPGVSEGYKPQFAYAKLEPTIVRGVLRLPGATNLKPQTASLLDVSGRRVMDLRPGANDVSRLAPGVYFVREEPQVASRKPHVVRKVVVAR